MYNQQPKQEPYPSIPNAETMYGSGGYVPGQQGYQPPLYPNGAYQQQGFYSGAQNVGPVYVNGYAPGQQGYPPPMYANAMYVQSQADPGRGAAIASLVLGIVSIVLSVSMIGIICAILGLVFANQGSRSITSSGLAKTGRILSIIGMVIAIMSIVFTLLFLFIGFASLLAFL